MMSAHKCALCGSPQDLSFHHLIPRSCHRNKWFRKRFTREEMQTRGIMVCSPCHSMIHHFYVEKELGRNFNTLANLLDAEKLQPYLRWVRTRGNRA